MDRPHDFKSKLRQSIAVWPKIKPFKNHIGQTAIGRRVVRSLLCNNQRISGLRVIPPVNAHGQCGQINRLAVGPNAPDKSDCALAKAYRHIGVIAIRNVNTGFCLARTATNTPFATLWFGGRVNSFLLHPRCPDNLATEPCAAIEAGNGRAFCCGNAVEVFQARSARYLAPSTSTALCHGLIDGGASCCANSAADGATDRPTNKTTDHGPNSLKNKCGHVLNL